MRFLVAIFVFVFNAGAATYYVRTDGNDGNPGTANTSGGAWLTVQHAVNTAAAGDDVHIANGTYAENVTGTIAGTSGSLISFGGAGIGVKIQRINVTASFAVFTNFMVTSAAPPLFNGIFQFLSGSHDVAVTNVTCDPQAFGQGGVGSSGGNGFYVVGGSNVTFSGCTVTNCAKGATAVYIIGTNCTFASGTVRDCTDTDAFRVWGTSNHITQCLVTNILDGPCCDWHSDFLQIFTGNGVGSTYLTLDRNLVVNSQVQCFYMTDTEGGGSMVHHINFWNNIWSGVTKEAQWRVPFVTVANNLFYYSGTISACAVESTNTYLHVLNPGNTGSGNGSNAVIVNNLFISCGYSPTNVNWGWYETSGTLVGLVTNYNFVAGTAWAAKSGFTEPNGINGGNPQFLNAGGGDFQLQPGSPAIGAGTNMSAYFSTDYTGATRTRWSMGPLDVPTTTLNVSGSATVGTLRSAQ